jgi:hypothetical protein
MYGISSAVRRSSIIRLTLSARMVLALPASLPPPTYSATLRAVNSPCSASPPYSPHPGAHGIPTNAGQSISPPRYLRDTHTHGDTSGRTRGTSKSNSFHATLQRLVVDPPAPQRRRPQPARAKSCK